MRKAWVWNNHKHRTWARRNVWWRNWQVPDACGHQDPYMVACTMHDCDLSLPGPRAGRVEPGNQLLHGAAPAFCQTARPGNRRGMNQHHKSTRDLTPWHCCHWPRHTIHLWIHQVKHSTSSPSQHTTNQYRLSTPYQHSASQPPQGPHHIPVHSRRHLLNRARHINWREEQALCNRQLQELQPDEPQGGGDLGDL